MTGSLKEKSKLDFKKAFLWREINKAASAFKPFLTG